MSIENILTIAQELLNNHPYFSGKTECSHPNGKEYLLGDRVLKNAVCVIYVTPKNGVKPGVEHKIIFDEVIEDGAYINTYYNVFVTRTEENNGEIVLFQEVAAADWITNNLVALFFITLDSRMRYAISRGTESHLVPKEWRKCFKETLNRFCSESIIVNERVQRKQTHYKQFGIAHPGAQFYPIGSVVEYNNLVFKGEIVVRSIVPSGFQNYVIKSGELYQEATGAPGSSVNTRYVTRIISRGKDRYRFPSSLIHMYHKLQFREDRDVTIADAQRELKKELFKNVVTTKNIWTVNKDVGEFITKYIECFYTGKLPDGFVHRFKSWLFYAVVCEEHFSEEKNKEKKWSFKINKNKMKKEMKRLHCYLDTVAGVKEKKANFIKMELEMYDRLFNK